mmetsp:Transcript_6927/g.22983  ORF Transcript_6927/g.22983 Transcript_6927/m.22983 type:complete len:304 (+) Transcript_6927:1919-2830(+)
MTLSHFASWTPRLGRECRRSTTSERSLTACEGESSRTVLLRTRSSPTLSTRSRSARSSAWSACVRSTERVSARGGAAAISFFFFASSSAAAFSARRLTLGWNAAAAAASRALALAFFPAAALAAAAAAAASFCLSSSAASLPASVSACVCAVPAGASTSSSSIASPHPRLRAAAVLPPRSSRWSAAALATVSVPSTVTGRFLVEAGLLLAPGVDGVASSRTPPVVGSSVVIPSPFVSVTRSKAGRPREPRATKTAPVSGKRASPRMHSEKEAGATRMRRAPAAFPSAPHRHTYASPTSDNAAT